MPKEKINNLEKELEESKRREIRLLQKIVSADQIQVLQKKNIKTERDT